jgi:hypothetical protein
MLDEVRARPDRDEEVSLVDPARVDLNAGYLRCPGRSLELTGRELSNLFE